MTRRELIKKWIEALRSGEYKQADSRLSDFEDVYSWMPEPISVSDIDTEDVSFCCLGVATHVAAKLGCYRNDEALHELKYNEVMSDQVAQLYGFFGTSGELIETDLTEPFARSDIGAKIADLATFNDQGATFEEIADKIEERLNDLFDPYGLDREVC